MTRKELLQTVDYYIEPARKCLAAAAPDAEILKICGRIALERCYNHHEQGQRIWAFFAALEVAIHE